LVQAKRAAAFVAKLIEIRAAAKPTEGFGPLIEFVAQPGTSPLWLRALGDGLRRAGTTIEQSDVGKKLAAVFTRAAATAVDTKASEGARLEAVELLSVSSYAQSREPLTAALSVGQPEAVQVAAIKTLAQQTPAEVSATLIRAWPHYGAKAKDAALAALIAREDRTVALLEAISAGKIKATDLSASQVQNLAHHKTPRIAALAKTALAGVIPPSREEVAAKFQPAVTMKGDAARGKSQYAGRCMVCHRAGNEGMELIHRNHRA
jgi:mono/diheme cytochrome c family protein